MTVMSTSRRRSTSTPRCRAGRSPSDSRSRLRRAPQRDDEPDDHERQDRGDRLPGRPREASQVPEGDGAQGVVLGDEREHPDGGAREGAHGDAHEDERHHLGAAARAGQPVDEEGRDEAAHERRDGCGPRARDGDSQHDDQERAHGGTGGDADHGGLGQRVAEHALHERTRRAQGHAHEHPEHHAREPDLPQRGVSPRRGRLGQDPVDAQPMEHAAEDLVERDPELADAGGQEARDHEGDDEHGDHEAAPARHVRSAAGLVDSLGEGLDGGTRPGAEVEQHAVIHIDDTPPLASRCLGDPGYRQQAVHAAHRVEAVGEHQDDVRARR